MTIVIFKLEQVDLCTYVTVAVKLAVLLMWTRAKRMDVAAGMDTIPDPTQNRYMYVEKPTPHRSSRLWVYNF